MSREIEYAPRDALAVEFLDDEALVWNPVDAALHRLNPSTTLIWRACDRWRTARAIVADVASMSGQADATIRADVERTLETLTGLQLLRRRGGP